MSVSTPWSELDLALERHGRFAPEYGGGLADHAPMVVEALATLGRPAAIGPWLAAYVGDLEPAPAREPPLGDADAQGALGNPHAYPRWLARFEADLGDAPWRTVAARWLPRLAPGFAGAAAHGAIRAAHSLRALEGADTPPRRAELARALAYWAARFEVLPGWDAPPAPRRLPPLDLLRALPTLQPASGARPGFIVDGLRDLATLAPFQAVAGWLDPAVTRRPGALDDLGEALALLFLAQGGRRIIAFTHAVTGCHAARTLLRISAAGGGATGADATGELLMRAAWHTAAAIHAAFGDASTLERDLARARADAERDPLGPDELTDLAIRNGSEHAIKLAEAGLCGYRARGSRVWLAVARVAVERVRG